MSSANEIRLPTLSEYRGLLSKTKVMKFRQFIPYPPETVVRYLGQVDMMNYRAGNPRPVYKFIETARGGSITQAKATKGGLTLEYVELPYEWNVPHFGRAELFFSRGPLRYVCLEYTVTEMPGGSEVYFEGRRVSKGLGILGWLVGRKFMTGFATAIQILQSRALPETEDPLNIAPFTDGEKINGVHEPELNQKFAGLHKNQRVAEMVAKFIAEAPDKFVAKIKPLQIAAQYGLPENDTIEFFLRATRKGFFNLSWDLLCPSCRGDKARVGSLSDLGKAAHCDYCNINYDADFSKNVELTFHPVQSLRKIFGTSYCINSPGNTAFIRAQFNIWPDKSETRRLDLSETHYELRSTQLPGTREIIVAEDGASSITINLTQELDGTAKSAPLRIQRNASVEFINSGNDFITVKFYRDAFKDFALTASRVTALQEFRDQFGAEALAPGLQIGVENLCFLFTDLKDSTPMYEAMGDAPAFALVRDHFSILIDEVRKNDGAVVKTIGDAVMAVFISKEKALLAAVAIQHRIHTEHPKVSVKIGLHAGPCLAVTSNEKLDYFGTTVNRAARIQGMADGRDIVMSPEIEPEAVGSQTSDFDRVEFKATLKGFAQDAHLVRWRLK